MFRPSRPVSSPVLDAYSREHTNGTIVETNASGATPSSGYKCRGIYLGNTIFAPVLGSVRLHVLRQLHDIRRCLGLLALAC